MASTVERYGWAVLMGLLITLAIPWFLWGDSRTALGLPLWLWWHIGWMVLASASFWLFTRRAWGLWIHDAGGDPA
jgi:ribose/xylose/arabinose/galactoside ABC-type transport system permease subunit